MPAVEIMTETQSAIISLLGEARNELQAFEKLILIQRGMVVILLGVSDILVPELAGGL